MRRATYATPAPFQTAMEPNPSGFWSEVLAWWQANAGTPFLFAALTRILQALLVGLGALLLARFARRAFERATVRTWADPNSRLLVGRILYLGILLIGALTALDALGVPLVSLLAFLGAATLAISLSVQDILKNFFAGVYLLFERPFRIGDEIGLRDYRGRVEHVGFRTTTIRTDDNVLVLIPNAVLFAEIVLNRTWAKPTEDAMVEPEQAERTT